MVDSVQVFSPGFRVTDANDNPISGAKIKFRAAGPGAPKTVYADAALTVPLGTIVRTRADGQPVASEGSATTTLIYVGSDPYHIEITDADDAVIVPAQDNVRGAFTVAASAAVIPPVPVITTGTPLTLTAEHQGKLINATGVTLTLAGAVSLGDGWWVKIRNNGSSGVVTLVAPSGVSFEGQTFTQRALLPGEAMEIVSDGTAFRVSSHTAPLLARQGAGIITLAGRVSSAPGAPVAGGRYLVISDFDTFVAGQIIEYNGVGYNAYSVPEDSGWLAYVPSEDTYYRRIGSGWTSDNATTSVKGFVQLADVGAMEARTASRVATADVLHHHPGVAKFWAFVNASSGTPSLVSSYNVSSISDGGDGLLGVNIDVDFSSDQWCCIVSVERDSGNDSGGIAAVAPGTRTAGSVTIESRGTGAAANATLRDPAAYFIAGFGDQ